MTRKARAETAEHIVRIKEKDLSLTRETKPSTCGCCRKKYIGLLVIGCALFAVGGLLGIAYFSVKNVTSSISLTESRIPSCVTGALMVANGINAMILFKRRQRCLIISSIIFTVSGGLFCFAGAMHSLTAVSPMLSSFDSCQYFSKETSCKCFHRSDLRQVSFIFRGTENCKVIQYNLKNMVYGISGIYGAGLGICLIAGIMECLLLCPKRRSKVTYHSRSDGDGKCTVTSSQSQTSQTNLTLSCSEAELAPSTAHAGATASPPSSTSSTHTRRETQSTYVRELPCSHYVVDMSRPRRDYCINYNSSSSRHDPPPPYSE